MSEMRLHDPARNRLHLDAATSGIPVDMIQKWLGHAQLSTTAIYADAVGKEEQDIAERMWGSGRLQEPPAGALHRRRIGYEGYTDSRAAHPLRAALTI